MNLTEPFFTGTQINYYFVCHRKLWLFSHDVKMEQESDLVLQGKILHEESYKRKLKEIGIGSVKIDFLEKNCEIHEVKKSRKIEKAHTYQVLYYIYYLKKKGIHAVGVIDYPLLRKRERVELSKEKELEMKEILDRINKLVRKKEPPEAIKKPYCKKCSYYELCWC